MCRFIAVALWLPFAAAAFAQQGDPPAGGAGTLLTIYSSARFDEFDALNLMKGGQNLIPGMVIVQQRRTFELNEGESVIHLPDIVPSADFSTLTLRPGSADAFKVLSQSLVEAANDPD